MSPGETDTIISKGVDDIGNESEIFQFAQNDKLYALKHDCRAGAFACPGWQPMRLPYSGARHIQKMLNRRINSCRASMANSGFILLSTFSRRSRSMAASSRTSWLRAFHFAYLPQPMPSASSAEMIQTVMSVAVTRSITSETDRANLQNTALCCKIRLTGDRRSLKDTG